MACNHYGEIKIMTLCLFCVGSDQVEGVVMASLDQSRCPGDSTPSHMILFGQGARLVNFIIAHRMKKEGKGGRGEREREREREGEREKGDKGTKKLLF